MVGNLEVTNINVIDILLVLDISSSMLADDFLPNRLDAVKKAAIEFVKKEEMIELELLFLLENRLFNAL